MKKKMCLFAIFLMIMSAGLISAATFSFSDALSNIEEKTLVILVVFVISFALLFFSLSRAFKSNIPIAAVISFALSFGLTYWVNKSDFDLSGWVYDLGISTEILSILIPLLVAVVAIFMIVTLKRDSLLVFGGLFLASALFVYEKTIVIVIGVVLVLVRILWRKNGSRDDYSNYLKHLLRERKRKR